MRASPAAAESQALGWLLMVTGAAGLLAAWVITVDKFKLLEEPGFVPSCSLNPIVACGNVMSSEQAEVFGFPNSMLGLVAYSIVTCAGASLLAHARFSRWYWLTFNAGISFGVAFCTWLIHQSLYSINSLCLWCCLVWVVTIIMFWYVTAHNVRRGFLPSPVWMKTLFDEFTWAPPVLHTGIVGVLILTRWWDFWTS